MTGHAETIPDSLSFVGAAPRHILNDTKRHIVKYTATAKSRFEEYFPEHPAGGFTRDSEKLLLTFRHHRDL